MFTKYAKEWDWLSQNVFSRDPYFDSRFVGPVLKCFASGHERLCAQLTDGSISRALIVQSSELALRFLMRKQIEGQNLQE